MHVRAVPVMVLQGRREGGTMVTRFQATEEGSRVSQYLSAPEVARRLEISRQTVCRWIRKGYLEARRAGAAPTSPWRVPLKAVEALERRLAGKE